VAVVAAAVEVVPAVAAGAAAALKAAAIPAGAAVLMAVVIPAKAAVSVVAATAAAVDFPAAHFQRLGLLRRVAKCVSHSALHEREVSTQLERVTRLRHILSVIVRHRSPEVRPSAAAPLRDPTAL